MPAKEVKRIFDTARKMIIIDVQDDFGNITHLQVHFGQDCCPECQRPYPLDELKIHDVGKLLREHKRNVDRHTQHTIKHFSKHGADMKALKKK